MRTISPSLDISLFPIDHEITIDIGQFEIQISLLVERKWNASGRHELFL